MLMSFQMFMKSRMRTVMLIGLRRGKTIRKNTCSVEAPSMNAASSSALGIPLMNPV